MMFPDDTEEDQLARRQFLGAGSAVLAGAALSGLPLSGQEAKETTKAEHDASAADPGPENQPIAAISSSGEMPPSSDHGAVPGFWYSFSIAHKRVQEGGWSRQVNVEDFPISTQIAGVNMKLTAGGVRELHWHQAAEWAYMLNGKARITAIDNEGKPFVNDVQQGDLWYFPTGVPHSIQGLAPDGCEFMLVFDDGKFSEFDTTLVSEWTARTPKSVLAKNWGVPESALSKMPEKELYIFQAAVPPPLEQTRRPLYEQFAPSPIDFSFKMEAMPPTQKTESGEVRIVDSTNFPISITIAAVLVTLKPGGLRELHWHPNSDEWQYYLKGKGRMTLFINQNKGRTMDFRENDTGYVPKTMGHYIENTGDTDLVFLEILKANKYVDFSLSQWLRRTPPELVMSHLRISQETFNKIPAAKGIVVPA